MAAWALRPGGVTTGNDDALYLLLARSLRGFAYRDIHMVGAPWHSQYPPGYPALLALTEAVFGDRLGPVHLATILCSIIALFFAFDLARRLAGVWPALGLLAALSVNRNLIEYASGLRSEPAYMALSLGALWAYLVIPHLRARLWSVGALAVLAGLTRSVGISLVGAVFIVLLLERRWLAAGAFGLLGCGVTAAWVGWTIAAPVQFGGRSYILSLAENRYFAQRLAGRVADISMAYLVRGPLAGLGVPSVPDMHLDNLLWLLLLWGLCALGAGVLWRTHRLAVVYLGAFFGVLAVYPYLLTRFFMPIIPVFLIVVMAGLSVVQRRHLHVAVGAGALLIGGLAFNGTHQLVQSLDARSACEVHGVPEWTRCLPLQDQAFFKAIDYAKQNLPADAVVLTAKEAPFAFYTGLPVLHPEAIHTRSPEEYLSELSRKGIRYILLSAYPGGDFAARALLKECLHLEVVFSAEPMTWLLRVGADSLASERSGSCRALKIVAASAGSDAPDPFQN